MKLLTTLLCLAPAVLGLPTSETADPVVARQTPSQITDQYLYSITLAAFTSRRNAKDPATLIWDSDGCSASPDNPFGFPFIPACHRHDFGYRNYKAQSRFTDDGKLKVDKNFKTDLYHQCSSVGARGVCEALADVYYAAVRAFGGSTQSEKRDDDLVREYEEKLAIYNKLVAEAQDKGELWRLE